MYMKNKYDNFIDLIINHQMDVIFEKEKDEIYDFFLNKNYIKIISNNICYYVRKDNLTEINLDSLSSIQKICIADLVIDKTNNQTIKNRYLPSTFIEYYINNTKNDKTKNLVKRKIQAIYSLAEAIDSAGGGISTIFKEYCKNSTFWEFVVCKMGQNDIMFKHMCKEKF